MRARLPCLPTQAAMATWFALALGVADGDGLVVLRRGGLPRLRQPPYGDATVSSSVVPAGSLNSPSAVNRFEPKPVMLSLPVMR